MLRTTLAVVLMSISMVASARGVEVCPELPANSGVEWVYQEGPDFDLCYARESLTKKDAFGVYLGRFPSFNPKNSKPIGKGKVAGRKVAWYPRDSDEYHPKLGRQTIIKLKAGELAHIWLGAESEPQLQTRLLILQSMKFKN